MFTSVQVFCVAMISKLPCGLIPPMYMYVYKKLQQHLPAIMFRIVF